MKTAAHAPGPWRNESCGGWNEIVASPVDGRAFNLQIARVHNDAIARARDQS